MALDRELELVNPIRRQLWKLFEENPGRSLAPEDLAADLGLGDGALGQILYHLRRLQFRGMGPGTGKLTKPEGSEFAALPKERPPEWETPGPPADWLALFRLLVHPIKVSIAEALHQARQPLSSSEIWLRAGIGRFSRDNIIYHVGSMAELGLLEATGQRRVRGACETFYYFAPVVLAAAELGEAEVVVA